MAKFNAQQIKKEFSRLGIKGTPGAQDIVNANKYGLGIFKKNQAKIYAADTGKIPDAPPTTVPDATIPTTPIPTYDEWLQGAGSPYANQSSADYLNAEYNPLYDQQVGVENNQKQLAQERLGRNIADTTNAENTSFNNRGLYGSGVYQNELGKNLDTLNRGFNENYGAGQYTPFSQRLFQIEQNRRFAKESAGISRQGQAWNVYSQQYYPTLSLQ